MDNRKEPDSDDRAQTMTGAAAVGQFFSRSDQPPGAAAARLVPPKVRLKVIAPLGCELRSRNSLSDGVGLARLGKLNKRLRMPLVLNKLSTSTVSVLRGLGRYS